MAACFRASSLRAGQVTAFFFFVAVGSWLAGVLGSTPPLASAQTCGTQQKQWVYVTSTLAAYGFDGYLRHPSNSLQNPNCNFFAHFLAVHNSSGSKWVQVGLTIGVLPSPPDGPGGVPTTYKIYSDGVNHCGSYNLVNHGDPSGANRSYYINYFGQSGSDGCGSWAKYAIRKNDWFTSPIWYRYIDVASPKWTAEHEVLRQTSDPWQDNGQPWWGHETATTWPVSFGLHWYDYPSGTWNTWNSAGSGPGYISQPGGLTQQYSWCVDSFWRAHRAKKGSC